VTGQPDLILHVGAPKCGSSAVQTVLSRRPAFSGLDGQRYAYCCLNTDGSLLSGRALRVKATLSPFGFACSRDATRPEQMRQWLPAARALRQLRADGSVPILSSEGWARRAALFAEAGLIEQAGGNAHVIVFVRPPVEWLNSAWWQWGVWTGNGLDRFIARNVAQTRWADHIDAWRRVPGVARVSVRLSVRDVVPQFFGFLGAKADASNRSNSGVPPAFLYFQLRNRRFRSSAHASQTEFAVGRHLKDGQSTAPWVLPQDVVAAQMQALAPVTAALTDRLEPEQRRAMEDDPRWWTPDAYAERPTADPADHTTPDALLGLYDALAGGLGPLDQLRHRSERRRFKAAISTGGLEAVDTVLAAMVDRVLAKDLRRRGRRLIWL
jgi:hypothetical protein